MPKRLINPLKIIVTDEQVVLYVCYCLYCEALTVSTENGFCDSCLATQTELLLPMRTWATYTYIVDAKKNLKRALPWKAYQEIYDLVPWHFEMGWAK